MTVTTQTNRASYDGNGVTTAFTIPFRILEATHVKVITRVVATGVETEKVYSADYTVSGADNPTATLNMNAAPATGTKVIVLRSVPATQEKDYVEGDAFPAESHEKGLDKLTMLLQQISEIIGRAIIVSPGSDATGLDKRAVLVAPGQTAPTMDLDVLKGGGLGIDADGEFTKLPTSLLTLTADNILDATALGKSILRMATVTAGLAVFGGFDARSDLQAAFVAPDVKAVTTRGYATSSDGGGGTHVRLLSTPSPAKRWHTQSADGAWWELRSFTIRPKQLGAVLDGVADDLVALQAWMDYSAAFKVVGAGSPGSTPIASGSLNYTSGARIIADGEMTLIRASDVIEPLLLADGIAKPVVRGLRFQYTAGTTSTTSHAFSAGSKSFTVGAGRGFVTNQFVVMRPTASPINYIIAQVTSYSGTTLNVTTSTVSGSGTYANWYIQSYANSSGSGYTPAAMRYTNCTEPDGSDNTFLGRFFVGLGLQSVSRARIVGNRFTEISDRSIENNSFSGALEDNQIFGNFVQGNGWTFYGVNCAATTGNETGLSVMGNKVRGVLSQGVSVSGQNFFASVSDNNIKMNSLGAGATGVCVFFQALGALHPYSATIVGNNLSGGSYGIYLLDVSKFVATGNNIEQCGTDGILVQATGSFAAGYASALGNNSMQNCVGNGIQCLAAVGASIGGVTITGNSTYANGGWGILVGAQTLNFTVVANSNLSNTSGAVSTAGTGHQVANNA